LRATGQLDAAWSFGSQCDGSRRGTEARKIDVLIVDTLKSVANTGVAVASNRPAAKADRAWQGRRSVDEESLNISCLAFGMADSIKKIKAAGGR